MGSFEAEEVIPEYSSERVFPPGADLKFPSLEEFLEALDSLDMPEADKEEIRKNAQQHMGDMALEQTFSYYTFMVAVVFLALIFIFFGYKLYRSLTEKERKREEKRKLKQKKKQK